MRSKSPIFTLTRHRKFSQALTLCVCILGLCTFATAGQPTIVTFDPPGSIYTFTVQINLWGTIIGSYLDANYTFHGFRRTLDGKITSYDAPCATGSNGSLQGTALYSINSFGSMGGDCLDANNIFHGFLLSPEGKYQVFDAPDAGTGHGQGTFLENINDLGDASGNYFNTGDHLQGTAVWRGFFRAADGVITEFDVSGAGTGPNQGTETAVDDGLNDAETTAGAYVDDMNAGHGFIRNRYGDITKYDPAGSSSTNTAGINNEGQVVGGFADANGVNHGYVRYRDGQITQFDVPGAGTGSGQGTLGESIADGGGVAGVYIDAGNVNHGFLRAPNGQITKIDVPAAGKGAGQGTTAGANNAFGLVAGTYIDSNNVHHGFLWIP